MFYLSSMRVMIFFMIELLITPVAKPRQTRSDKWRKRPCVMKYRAFADKLRFLAQCEAPELTDTILSGAAILFVVPMPKSWSKKKKARMVHAGHGSKPDIDNLIKAVLDALLPEDSEVATIAASKVWGRTGSIMVAPFDWNEQVSFHSSDTLSKYRHIGARK